MIAAILVSGYALAVAWCVPALLAPLTARGISALVTAFAGPLTGHALAMG